MVLHEFFLDRLVEESIINDGLRNAFSVMLYGMFVEG